MLPDEDPDFRMPPKSAPGEEFTEQQKLDRQFGCGMDPTDYDRGFAVRYSQGVEWVCTTNTLCHRAVSRLGHIEEVKQRAVTGAIWGPR